MNEALQAIIDAAWEERETIGPGTGGEIKDAVGRAIGLLDSGRARVAEKGPEGWRVERTRARTGMLASAASTMVASSPNQLVSSSVRLAVSRASRGPTMTRPPR